jgi:large subunit ribosomal protein L10
MDRSQKKQWIADLNGSSLQAEIMIVTHYKGLTVAEISRLRSRVRVLGASFKVTKNSLAKLALAGTQFETLTEHFKGPTAIAYAKDPVAAAKVISEFSKENEKLVLLGAAFGNQVLDANGIKELAKLPSLDELRATIIALIMTPATRIAGVTAAPAGQLARVIGAYADKQSS